MVSLSTSDLAATMLVASPFGLMEWPRMCCSSVAPSTANTKSVASGCKTENDIRNKLGRNYNPGRPLALSVRQRILDLHEKGHKITHIARMIGVTHSCVSKIMSKYKQTGSVIPRGSRQYEAANDLIRFMESPSKILDSTAPIDDITNTMTTDSVITSAGTHVQPQPVSEKLFSKSLRNEQKNSAPLEYSIERCRDMVHRQHQTLLPPVEGQLSAQPFMNNCYSEMCMSNGAVAPASHEKKLGWVVAAIFIVADMVGGGVVAMPVAFKKSGLAAGIIFMIVIAIMFEYTGYQLGVVWCKMMERFPHLGVCRKPFPEMAKRTMGPGMQRFTSVMGNITLFGISVVYLLLSSKILQYFVDQFTDFGVGICHVIVILAITILPFTFLKSPGEFAGVIVIAMITTVVAVLSILLGISMDAPECYKAVRYPEQDGGTVMLSLGIFLFSFSGHYVFPTIQHDMKNPRDFTKSVVAGFGGVVLLYMPLSVLGYTVYGDSLDSSVITSIQTSSLQLGANLMIAVHCIMTLVIVINPLNQEVEHYLKISHGFGYGRVITRTVVLVLVLFVGLSVPDFSPVMNIVGASTIPIGCVFLPSLFYLWCEATEEDEWRKGHIPSFREVIRRTDSTVLIINMFMLGIALVGGCVGTYVGVEKLKDAEFSAPCYIRPFLEDVSTTAFSISQRCCGAYWNISTYGTPEICTPRTFNVTLS